jgi:hypothetical protein
MRAAIKVLSDIARSKLPPAKNFVGLGLGFGRKLGVNGARVHEERSFGQLAIFLDGQMVSGCGFRQQSIIYLPRGRLEI